jgi:type IV secretory pathway VirB10-like protein
MPTRSKLAIHLLLHRTSGGLHNSTDAIRAKTAAEANDNRATGEHECKQATRSDNGFEFVTETERCAREKGRRAPAGETAPPTNAQRIPALTASSARHAVAEAERRPAPSRKAKRPATRRCRAATAAHERRWRAAGTRGGAETADGSCSTDQKNVSMCHRRCRFVRFVTAALFVCSLTS